ncbi:MAG: NAD(P)/FAD-dependent oxidoreductase [Solirubrobacteraceae bacterium]|nr:NAD(P)/FAD-dependent oxidoreductase [Solirubrobacteraceae bacterium]
MPTVEHLDVLIIGAGLSGIGAAHHLKETHPGRSVALLDMRDDLGGTWNLFRYPGIRSDSDMHTLGFGFRPWDEARTLADGPSILQYLRDTAAEDGTVEKIRFGHKVISAAWSSEDATWTVTCEVGGDTVELTCNFLLNCSGYYRYDEGFTPHFEGREDFKGEIIHPQHWPEDFDYTGKRVVVIGSGATAITLVPAMVEKAEHVTMLQRSPTYVTSLPYEDPVALKLRKVLPKKAAFGAVRWKNVMVQLAVYQLSQRRPAQMKKFFIANAAKQLPKGFDVKKHFTPKYNPWDQRLCVVPHGDLFKAIKRGDATIATDRIKTFTETGLELESGDTLDADVIITATGLNLLLFGGIEFSVDGTPVDMPDAVAYKGLMLSGVPNFAFAIGYTNASWTLKADLVGGYIGRLLSHMDKRGTKIATPQLDGDIETQPLLDFSAGYVQRSLGVLPKQGKKAPWTLKMNYPLDLAAFKFGKVDDGTMRFTKPAKKMAPASPSSNGKAPTATKTSKAA